MLIIKTELLCGKTIPPVGEEEEEEESKAHKVRAEL